MSENGTVVWGEEAAPPAPKSPGGTGFWADRVEEHYERPGEWAKYGPYSAGSITRTIKRAIENSTNPHTEKLGKPGEWEITTRTDDEDKVWAHVKFRKPLAPIKSGKAKK